MIYLVVVLLALGYIGVFLSMVNDRKSNQYQINRLHAMAEHYRKEKEELHSIYEKRVRYTAGMMGRLSATDREWLTNFKREIDRRMEYEETM